MTAKVFLKPRKAKPFWYGEPWVFDGSIDRIKNKAGLGDGDIVEVYDESATLIGRGFYSPKSPIRVRLATRGEAPLDLDLIIRRLDRAIALRHETGRLPDVTNAYRVVHAEGDGLPGLIVDRLGDHLVVQLDIAGIRNFRREIVELLQDRFAPKSIYERVSRSAREQEALTGEEGLLAGDETDGPVEVEEHGIRYLVDFRRGQKTGFYADQRDNRLAFARFVRDRDVLDCFSYTGAFAFAALKHGGARRATAIDSSAPALEMATATAELNGFKDFAVDQKNVLRHLDHVGKSDERFGAVMLDPPKLVPKKSALRRGLKLYREINAKGMSVLEEGGILATSSCSQAVTEDEFGAIIAEAAVVSGRGLQLLHVGGQGLDHPSTVPHDVSRYLKFRIYRVT